MNINDKQYYKDLKRNAKAEGLSIVQNNDAIDSYNGYTVAYKKACASQDCRMVIVAVSDRAPEDTFKRKVGKYQALRKYYRGEVIQLPLANEHELALPNLLLDIFNV